MANEEFAQGFSPCNDALALGWHAGYNRWWEQNGVTPTSPEPDYSANPVAHLAWRKARSDDNKTKGVVGRS